MRPPTWFEWLTVLAIILGPIVALWIQRGLDRRRAKRAQRHQVYFTLMATRAQHLAPEHVRALNSIDIVFNERKDQKIRAAWGRVMQHFDTDPTQPKWDDRLFDLKCDLYHAMGATLGYTFGLDHLKRKVYNPQHYFDNELASRHIRDALVKVLTDDGVLVKIVGEPEAKS